DDKKFNNAGALFSDSNQFSGIDIARFGDSISEILDRETISGVSILKEYDDAVSVFRRYYQYDIVQGIERQTVDKIPEEAYREAVANALVHRTWDINSHIRIAMFSDKIEISSPGGLPKGITEEEYLSGAISNLRNPIIGNVFFRLHYIEMFGTGIRRIKDSYANAQIKPDFTITDNSISVTLPCIDRKIEVSEDGRKVLDVLGDGRILSSREISEKIVWSKDKTIRVLNTILAAGYIQKVGSGRGTKYRKR
ncbi:MAG: AAA family ATPase, partial [Mogibacterium sp.]|nr:AAA family ATPase [Mogibacterium sp.]